MQPTTITPGMRRSAALQRSVATGAAARSLRNISRRDSVYRFTARVLAALTLCAVLHTDVIAQGTCRAASAGSSEPTAVMERAIGVLGLDGVDDHVRESTTRDIATLDYQSDRPYPPYFSSVSDGRLQVGWKSGLLRMEQGGGQFALLSDSSRQVVVSARGAQLVPTRTPNLIDNRAMDPWTVLSDWRYARDVRAGGDCKYRDFWRTVVVRGKDNSEQRLFLDPKTGFPVKLERREVHPLYGDVLAEYLWSIWTPVAGTRALAPQFSFRLVDGEVAQQRIVSRPVFAADSTALRFPAEVAAMVNLPPLVPDTVRVGPTTFLLRTASYTNVVSLQADTVWILDAQTNEQRARQDSLWIGRLFPGRHALALVVTDLAFPHIAGVRYWVANGALVVSHPNSEAFLRRVVQRRWTLEPDLLARQRRPAFAFRPVSGGIAIGAGAVRVVPIDGIGSEGALMVYLPRERFLYASDYVQGGGPTSFTAVYAREVVAAARRAGLMPERFAAMHTPLTAWDQLPRFGAEP
ncbi:MAG: beta-lactamase protein [Gemmatimonadetes bacterium]|nr:beta-lactamase protein [Gemmatimonadota bacterium]